MRWRFAVFLCTFAGFALAGCGGSQKPAGGDYKQKVEVIKRPYQPPAPEPTPTSIDPDGSGVPSDPIYFDFDAYTVRADSRPVLERYADYLNKHARATVTISGHTDERGTTEYNLALGDERAKAARD